MRATETLAATHAAMSRVWAARLTLGFAMLAGAMLFFLGTSWDIQWHSYIGRDRTLIPPHIVMLAGVTLSGVAALVTVVSESIAARGNALLAEHSTAFATGFQSSLGAYLAGFAALTAAIAFPLDSYWHSLYGIDVAIWAPFHIMFIVGMALVALGAAYTLASTAHVAARIDAPGGALVAQIGVIAALATQLCLLTLLLFDAIRGPLYPIMGSFLGGWVLVAARYAVPWRWSAAAVALVTLALVGIVFGLVPPATDNLVMSEQLAYLRGHAGAAAIVAVQWPLTAILAAPLLDGVFHAARRRNWGPGGLTLGALAVTLLCGMWLPPFAPGLALAMALKAPTLRGVIALAFGILGAWGGVTTGQVTGQSLRLVERA
jgi:hypothetical protein